MSIIPKLSEERKQEATSFIKEALDIYETVGREAYKVYQSTVKGRGGKIVDFFRLPKTELHKRFRAICLESLNEEQKAETAKTLSIMKQNKKDFGEEQNLSNREIEQTKYKKLKQYDLMSGEKLVIIGIPYQKRNDKFEDVTKFGKTMCIYNSRTPQLYRDIIDGYEQYTKEYVLF